LACAVIIGTCLVESHMPTAVLQQILVVEVQASYYSPSAMPFPDDKDGALDVVSEEAGMRLLSSHAC